MIRLVSIVLLVVDVAAGQTAGLPAFEAADIRPSAATSNPDSLLSGGFLHGSRYDLRRATMLDLIRLAWDTDADKITGGPAWLELDRFDIAAKAPADTPPETINLMLRSLLTDRFHLALHKDTKPFPAFALVMRKGPAKLKISPGGNSGCQSQPQTGAAPYALLTCHNMTTGAFAETLRRMASDYLTAPVIDATGLTDSWDFDIRWNSRSRMPPPGTDRITIFDAIENQLGLKLEVQQIPTPVIAIDRVNRQPTANAAGIAQILPPRIPEFDVAAIKFSAPDEHFGYKRYPGGRVELHAFPMKMLIATAWDIDWDHMDERISAPKWVDSKRFDIIANTTAGSAAPRSTSFIDDDTRLMLRALLTSRFGVASHNEDRPVSAAALKAVKPKLTKADPANRTGCKEARLLANDPRDANPRLSRLVQCRNMTMADFARQLQTLDRVEATFNDVRDETGLKDAYDFTLNFSPRAMLQNRPAPDGAPQDPNGSISFTEAIRTQLGLQLETTKRPMSVMVIDRIEEQPSGN